ncbi:hypothetical protein MNBD_NITROSPINAE03-1660 [hydrothermal vent metagenome]|uniref:Nucleoside phosphorylase domain-containing protein n=1 Tax=hydrothermal vent metagenome TaxID=652676 RepID=A0A3B1CQT8_9ZZZZ
MNFQSEKALGLSAAMPIEITPVLDLFSETEVYSPGKFRIYKSLYKSMPIIIVETEQGKDRTARAVEYIHENFHIRRLVGFGLAGAVAPDLRTGDVVAPDRVSRADRPEDFIALDPIEGIEQWSGKLIVGGLAVEVDRPFYTNDKQAIAKTGALMVDMESYATVSTAKKHDIPVSIVRAILDESAYDLESIVKNKKRGPDYANFKGMAKAATRKNADCLVYALAKILENLPAP